MKNVVKMMEKASQSKWTLRKLNFILSYGIPFNRPHGFKIKSIEENAITSIARYQRRNFNHIHGIHACAIATIGEYSAGLTLMMKFLPEQYRIIMSQLEVKYHYQAKQDLLARAEITQEQLSTVNAQLNEQDKVNIKMITEVHDVLDNHIATVCTTWQLKPWSKVKLKLK